MDTIDEQEENAQSEMRTTQNNGFITSKTLQKSATKGKSSEDFKSSPYAMQNKNIVNVGRLSTITPKGVRNDPHS